MGRGPTCKDERCLFHTHQRNCGGEYDKIKSPDPAPGPGMADGKQGRKRLPGTRAVAAAAVKAGPAGVSGSGAGAVAEGKAAAWKEQHGQGTGAGAASEHSGVPGVRPITSFFQPKAAQAGSGAGGTRPAQGAQANVGERARTDVAAEAGAAAGAGQGAGVGSSVKAGAGTKQAGRHDPVSVLPRSAVAEADRRRLGTGKGVSHIEAGAGDAAGAAQSSAQGQAQKGTSVAEAQGSAVAGTIKGAAASASEAAAGTQRERCAAAALRRLEAIGGGVECEGGRAGATQGFRGELQGGRETAAGARNLAATAGNAGVSNALQSAMASVKAAAGSRHRGIVEEAIIGAGTGRVGTSGRQDPGKGLVLGVEGVEAAEVTAGSKRPKLEADGHEDGPPAQGRGAQLGQVQRPCQGRGQEAEQRPKVPAQEVICIDLDD